MSETDARQARRFQMLKLLYDKRAEFYAEEGRRPSDFFLFPAAELRSELGLSPVEAEQALTYLIDEGLVKKYTFRDVSIEHAGVKAVEEALDSPRDLTDHFPARVVQHFVNTGGGAYIEGDVGTAGGDVVGRDQVKIGTLVGNILFGNTHAQRARREQENRKAMMQKVRHAWIDGVLEQSLYHVARIDLGLEGNPDAVVHPWDMIVQEQGLPPRDLAPGTRMGEVFDDLGGALLILGAPGTGKTTLLLELAQGLLDRAQRDNGYRIPVVFNLSSWAVHRKPLVEWLVDELNDRYDVPRGMGQAWVDDERILPLLDGLDEVVREHRADCVEAINVFRGDHGLVPLVVCSRVEEYEPLTAKLRLSGAVVIQPMTREQVDDYLARTGQPLTGVREALQADETLYELFDTPLMLSIAALTYQDASVQPMHVIGSTEERRKHLFAAYVDAMFSRRGKEHPYTRAQAERWLEWLARQMADCGQSVFYLEWMQPDWLSVRVQWRLVAWGLAIVLGLVLGASGGLTLGLISGLAYGSTTGLAFGSVAGLVLGLVGVLYIGVSIHDRDIRPAERLHWSWSAVRANFRTILVFALVVGVSIGIGLGSLAGLSLGLVTGLVFGLVCSLCGGLVSGLVGGLVFGLIAREMDARTLPNEGMLHSAQSGLVAGLIAGLVVGLVGCAIGGTVGGIVGGWVGGLVIALAFGLGSAPIFGLVGGLEVGGRACLQHLVLRLLLWQNDFAPLSYVRFLDYAAERIFLRKVGGGYIFVHRLLMEHFAAGWEETS
jgi:hypothetical protein